MKRMTNRLVMVAVCLGVSAACNTQAVDFHVTTAQELQNALTVAAGNGSADTVYLAAGYYIGNFNYNSAEAAALTIRAEAGVANTAVTVDGAGAGRSLAVSCSADTAVTAQGITFSRNCGNTANAGLRIQTGTGDGADVLVVDCRFIGVDGAQGIGLEVQGGRDVTIRTCTATRDATSSGTGINLYDSSHAVLVDRNVVSGTTDNSGRGAFVASAGAVTVTGNSFTGNLNGDGQGGSGLCVSAASASVSGNTFSGNSAYLGGGCHVSAPGAVVRDNTFSGNYGYNGGGAIVSGNGVSVSGNTFNGNSCGNVGGGVYVSGTGASVSNNTFSGNTGLDGGGLHVAGSGSSTIGNRFDGNTGSRDGGGVYINGSGGLVARNWFTDNRTSRSGGGLCLLSYDVAGTIAGNTFLKNRSTAASGVYHGGAIYADGATLTIVNNIACENEQSSPDGRGGGIYVHATAQLDLVNNTVFGNTTAGGGGGVAFQVDGVTEILNVYNNIIWGNTAAGNGDDVNLAGTGSQKKFMNNDAHDMYGVWDIAQNNIDQAPLFYDPVNSDYHQRFGSPTIDVGDGAAPGIPATDFDGEARVQDTAVDIGADEFNNSDLHPADVDQNGAISESEYAAYAAAWKNDQPWSRGPVPIPADYVTRAGYLVEEGGVYHNAGGAKPVCWKPTP